jgi:hypothetical protein
MKNIISLKNILSQKKNKQFNAVELILNIWKINEATKKKDRIKSSECIFCIFNNLLIFIED